MSEIDYHFDRYALYNIGMIETLCFLSTSKEEWWFIEKNNVLIHAVYDETGNTKVLMQFFGSGYRTIG
ncbi:hypothetical protein LCGC14_1182390 [marine sediment metagenome]|uniref:Uncharacterized protein n=1 Tax=marine sediment metagenome TaxID=412755 RepID=A0A0F9P4L8_9ZZZZ